MDSHRTQHTHSFSYPTSLLFSAPHHKTNSESGINPSSVHTSPRIRSSASSPGHPSKPWKTPPRARDSSRERISGPPLSSKRSTPRSEPSSFFDRIKADSRPWKSSPRKNDGVAEKQMERYQRTRDRVIRAVNPMNLDLAIAGDITHELLVHGAELIKLAPIPGLEGVARVLLGIWDALQIVETNRLACLRLTERCANILIAIQEEISGLDKRVADTLQEPVKNLIGAFEEIERLMLDAINQPSSRRYFRRDEILMEIANCNTMLQDCLGHFDRSINLRVLEYGLTSKSSPSPRTGMALHSKEEIHERLQQIQERQNELDRSHDILDNLNYVNALRSSQVIEKLGIEKQDIPDAIKTLLRTLESLRSTNVFDQVSTSLASPRRSSTWPMSSTSANALRLRDSESIERDIQALKAAYGQPVPTLPSWTITKFEIDLGDTIGRGFFSTVYKGKWGTRAVAVKVLEVHTSKDTFVNEVNLWKTLNHPNVLQLYGASSVEGTLPWFLVSPLMAHGSVADYLKRVNWDSQRHRELGSTDPDAGSRVDFLQMVHDIAEGMRYLHDNGIFHGDLKAANILLAEDLHCAVSDFGLSKLLHQIEQRNFLPNHALRWQAPELMRGESGLTKKADIYAYAMCCIEIFSMGSIPWPTMKDDDVRQHVLDEGGRPPYPDRVREFKFENLLHQSWHWLPSNRPSFRRLVQSLRVLREEVARNAVPLSPQIVVSPAAFQDQNFLPRPEFNSPVSDVPEDSLLLPRAEFSTPIITTLIKLDSEIKVPFNDEGGEQSPLDFDFSSSSVLLSTPQDDKATVPELYDDQFEPTYRMCLSHEFPRQLNFPLWSPGDVELGDIGFLSRSGQFIKLFNSIQPRGSSGGRMKISGVGNVSIAFRQQKDNLAMKGFKAISKLVTTGESGSDNHVKSRHTFSLSGSRTAFLYAEKTYYRYIQDSRPCKEWFRNHWRTILDEYRAEHQLLKEELMFVVETLSAQHYALFVNHGHLNDNAHFDVFTSPRTNEPWGAFKLPPEQPDIPLRLFHEKISMVGSPSKTILIARLRFHTDVEEPTLNVGYLDLKQRHNEHHRSNIDGL